MWHIIRNPVKFTRHPHCSLKWKATGMSLTWEKMKNKVCHSCKIYEVRDRRDLLDPVFHSSANLVQSYSLSRLLDCWLFFPGLVLSIERNKRYNGALAFLFCAGELHIQLKTAGAVLHDDALWLQWSNYPISKVLYTTTDSQLFLYIFPPVFTSSYLFVLRSVVCLCN